MARPFAVLGTLVIASAGCAQLAGIESTTGETGVTFSFEHESVGASIVFSPQDLTNSAVTYLVPDDTQPTGLASIPATQSAIDTWTANVRGTPEVTFTMPDFPTPYPRVWQFPSRNILGLYAILEHPDPTPAPNGAMFTIQATLDVPYDATQAFQTYTVGSWTQRVFAAAELPMVGATQLTATYPFASTTSLTGRAPEQLLAEDAFLVLRYVGNLLTGVMEATPFVQTGNDTVSGMMTAVAADQTYTATIDPAGAQTRYLAVRPAVTNFAVGWVITAAPGYEIASLAGPQLVAGSPAATDTTITTSYGNPFLVANGWHAAMQYGTSEYRTFTPAGQALPVTPACGMYEIYEPVAGVSPTLSAGLPITISVNGVPLVTDGMSIARPTSAVALDVQTDQPDDTYYQLQLYQLVPNVANTALQYQIVMGISGVTPSFTVPPDQFQPDKIYVFRAVTYQGGFPTIGDGNVQNRSLPIAVSYLDSGVFTVTP